MCKIENLCFNCIFISTQFNINSNADRNNITKKYANEKILKSFETFDLKNISKIGKPIAKYKLKNIIFNTDYYYKDWVKNIPRECKRMFSQKNILEKLRAVKIHITFFLTILASAPMLAQLIPFAIINDSDGYTNIRYGKNKITVDRLYSNQVFAIRSIVDDDGWQDWFWIDYPDYDQAKKPFERFVNKTKDGMIHKTRITLLPDLPQWKKSLADSAFICTRGLDKLTIRYGKFIKKNHTYEKAGYGSIVKIDGSEPWGIDGILYGNTTEIKSITLEINKQKYEFPREAIKNMLKPTNILANFGVAESSADTLFLYMSNSDAAGSYDVVWTIKSGKVVNQFIYRNF